MLTIDPARAPRRALTHYEVQSLFVCILRLATVRRKALERLRAEHFDPATEAHLARLLEVVRAVHAAHPEVLPYRAVMDAAWAAHEADPLPGDEDGLLLDTRDDCDPNDPEDRPGLIYRAIFETPAEAISEAQGRDLLARFVYERGACGQLRRALLEAPAGVIPELDRLLRDVQYESRVVTDDGTAGVYQVGFFPEEAGTNPVIPTGIAFMDALLGDEDGPGGLSGGTILGLAAPINSGKTTLMTQLAASYSAILRGLAFPTGATPPLVLYFTAEDSPEKINERFLAQAAQIRRSRLKDKGLRDLSRQGRLQPYEAEIAARWAAETERPVAEAPGEYERLMAARAAYTNFLIIDMRLDETGQSERSRGGVDELVGRIEGIVEARRAPVGAVFVDSLNNMAAREAQRAGGRRSLQDEIRARLKYMPEELRRRVGGAFHCPVWVSNQLNADAGKRAASWKPTLYDAAECRGWGEALDVAFGLSPKNALNFATLVKNKTRDTGGLMDSRYVRLDGAFGRWLDAQADVQLNEGTGELTPVGELEGLGRVGPAPGARHNGATRVRRTGNLHGF